MESTSPPPPTPNVVDPAADLATLKKASVNVGLEPLLNFGPAWYAPTFATVVACTTLAGRADSDTMNVAYLAVGVLACIPSIVHYYREHPVQSKFDLISFVAMLPVLFVTLVVVLAWGISLSTIGYEDFVPVWAIVGWLATTALFLGIRHGLSIIRDRRPAVG